MIPPPIERSPLQRLVERARALEPRTILILGWLVFLLYAYPGYMSSDSVDQLLDARVGAFNDWHSPTLSEIWRWVDFAIAGPFGMLILQSLGLLVGAYVVIARVVAPRRAALLASALLLFPPVLVPAAVIWQDSQLTGFLVAGLAAVTSARRGRQLAGLGLLVLASTMRPSAPLAVLPILAIGFVWQTRRGPISTGWRRAVVTLGTWAAVWLMALGLDACLVSQKTDHIPLDLASYDLLGVLRYARAADDAQVRDALAGVPVQGENLQRRGAKLYLHPGRMTMGPDRLIDPPETAEARAAIIDGARRLSRAFPRAYLVHRWHVFYRVVGLKKGALGRPLYTGYAGNASQADETAHLTSHSMMQELAIAAVAAFKSTPLFWPWVYLVLAIVLLAIAIARRHSLAALLLISGLVYELSLFVVAAEAQFWLSHWLITATSFAGLLLIVDAVGARLDRRRQAIDLGA